MELVLKMEQVVMYGASRKCRMLFGMLLVKIADFTCTTRFARSANELRSAERWSWEM